ncbi:MAG: gfo/Idh/MocA family oxidoreductase, partial [Gemmataceae bacterium]|nr:gfo/Idh/MocA family oxidoreductase [Gemmataceae bacterium]
WWYEYSGGKMTDWGAHHNDIAQWALGMDESGPIQVEKVEATEPDRRANCFNCHPTFAVRYVYGNGQGGMAGTELICRNGPPRDFPARNGNQPHNNGVLFEGENNRWIFVNRGTIIANDGNQQNSRIIGEALPQNATRLPVSNNHMANFIESVRNRRPPICHVGVGHRSVSVCHLGNIALQVGRPLRWDPAQERFTGDNAEAGNQRLSRPRRAPWDRVWRELAGNA